MVGRPTSFKPEFVEQARKLARSTGAPAHMALWLGEHRRHRIVFALRKKKRAHSPSQRIRNAMSSRMWAALKGRTDGALFSKLGYSVRDLCSHLERRFAAGMSWANYGRWHVDHIKPCALFDQTDPVQFALCWSLSNLQPLWASDNTKKGAQYVEA